jgi:GH15 family glucan-1,4-alpha-glucosidase
MTDPRAAAHAYPPIGDYAVIGDCRGVALVARDGAIDWLCWPRFDSPAVFAALLDRQRGGCFHVRPCAPYRTVRRYLPDTNIVETTFHTAEGSCVLRDLFAVATEAERRARLTPEQELLRELEGLSGAVELEMVYAPRPDYGRLTPTLEQRGPHGIWCMANRAAQILRSELPLSVADGTARGRATVRAGERAYVSLVACQEAPATIPALGVEARARIERAAEWWRAWVSRCRFAGPYRDAVVRSALALKLLSFAPSGAIVAAATTSLPELPGGDKNWDYRFCWLRDASLTLRALLALGYGAEADAFYAWLMHATRLTQPRLQVLYDVYGRARVAERELPWLAGYTGARPVRVGNAATAQTQLDVYGEVADAGWEYARRHARFDRDTTRLLNGIGQTVCELWREPDSGIWEQRGQPRHFTQSKALCWVALDRLIALHERHGLRLPVERLRRERAAIRAAIEARGFSARLNSYTHVFDGDAVDGSLLTLPLYGYISASHPRMRGTLALIGERLGHGALVYRDEQRGEGTFGICAFWRVECLARAGDRAAATAAFEELLTYANDVGLFAEELAADTGVALGNTPQAFTHVGLINAALALQRAGQEA